MFDNEIPYTQYNLIFDLAQKFLYENLLINWKLIISSFCLTIETMFYI